MLTIRELRYELDLLAKLADHSHKGLLTHGNEYYSVFCASLLFNMFNSSCSAQDLADAHYRAELTMLKAAADAWDNTRPLEIPPGGM